jgi:hypothetical protein
LGKILSHCFCFRHIDMIHIYNLFQLQYFKISKTIHMLKPTIHTLKQTIHGFSRVLNNNKLEL